MGEAGVRLHFEDADERPSTSEVPSGVAVKIISSDPSVGAYNVLADWKDSTDCYYNGYLTGEWDTQEAWVVRWVDGGSPIRFGDEVILTSKYKNQVLEEKGDYLAAKSGGSGTFRVLPPQAT